MRYVKPPTMEGLDALVAVSFFFLFHVEILYSFRKITYYYMDLFVQKKRRKNKDKDLSGNV